eukprot:jgi/Psemu1/15584/gm1.15584_g
MGIAPSSNHGLNYSTPEEQGCSSSSDLGLGHLPTQQQQQQQQPRLSVAARNSSLSNPYNKKKTHPPPSGSPTATGKRKKKRAGQILPLSSALVASLMTVPSSALVAPLALTPSTAGLEDGTAGGPLPVAATTVPVKHGSLSKICVPVPAPPVPAPTPPVAPPVQAPAPCALAPASPAEESQTPAPVLDKPPLLSIQHSFGDHSKDSVSSDFAAGALGLITQQFEVPKESSPAFSSNISFVTGEGPIPIPMSFTDRTNQIAVNLLRITCNTRIILANLDTIFLAYPDTIILANPDTRITVVNMGITVVDMRITAFTGYDTRITTTGMSCWMKSHHHAPHILSLMSPNMESASHHCTPLKTLFVSLLVKTGPKSHDTRSHTPIL